MGCFHVLIASCASCHQVLAPSPEAGRRAATSTSGRRGLLWRLRDKQARLGLFEIGPGHELHQLTCMMQTGLWAATQVSMDHPPTVSGPSVSCTSSVPRARLRMPGPANTAGSGIREDYTRRKSGAWSREGGTCWGGGRGQEAAKPGVYWGCEEHLDPGGCCATLDGPRLLWTSAPPSV